MVAAALAICIGEYLRVNARYRTATRHDIPRWPSMPHFFLHIRDGTVLVEDEEGGDFPNVEAACREAVLAAREIIASKLVAGEEVDGQIFEITDENNVVRATFPLRDVLKLK